MIYLKEFNTQAEYDAAVEANEIRRPNVSLVNEPFAVHYNKYVQLGVFIQHIDGSLYTKDEWSAAGFSNDAANGVAVVDELAMFVVAKENTSLMTWGVFGKLIEGITTTTNFTAAINDYSGYKNTQYLLADNDDNAGKACGNYLFPNGQKGYLPSLGELMVISKNFNYIQNCLSIIGTRIYIGDAFYWSSTQENATSAWSILLDRGFGKGATANRKDKQQYARVIAKL